MTARHLSMDGFPRFFRALWGRDLDPFPWQTRLLERVAAQGWPHTLDLPTAAGKTAVLDIAVFALALEADRAPAARRAPLRTVFVIDRRVVVDQAFHRADAIASKLAKAREGILGDVAHNLRRIQQPDGSQPRNGGVRSNAAGREPPPLAAAVLRGGMPLETDWARTPSQPLILVSTVDQVGSRLLFRGYGVSDAMRPVHAGLLGEDVLYLLDEVHLSRPFEDTLTAVKEWYAPTTTDALPHRFEVVRMSATPASVDHEVFPLTEADREHPVLAKRLRASKRAVLRLVTTPRNEEAARQKLAAACVGEARELFEEGVEVVAIIVNRVDTARRAAELADAESVRNGWSVRLMTGRMRPLDRQDLLRELEPRVRAGRDRASGARLLLVSTQSIEAGADFDFDGLVTECASLDAVRQRFGRLDRLGDRGVSRAVIVAGTGQTTGGEEAVPVDAVYGEALARTWAWLNEVAEPDDGGACVDFGVMAMEDRLRSIDRRLLAPSIPAPLLLPAHVDLYAQTSPRPAVEPSVALFLHGPERQTADVQVVWRADLEPGWLESAARNDDERALRDIIGVCPPSTLEAMPIPLGAARAWLARVAARNSASAGATETPAVPVPSVADVEGEIVEDIPDRRPIAPVLIWRGQESETTARSDDIRPGDTLVVPVSYGGIRNYSWDPDAEGNGIADRGDEAQLLQRARAVIRWHRDVVACWSRTGSPPEIAEDDVELGGVEIERKAFAEWARGELDAPDLSPWARIALGAVTDGRSQVRRHRRPFVSEGEAVMRVSTAARRVPRTVLRELRLHGLESESQGPILEAATDEEAATFSGGEVALPSHLRAVADFAGEFARGVGLSDALTADLALAGLLHDAGKADRRFQLMLHDGDPVRHAAATRLLAKSAAPSSDRAARARARRLAQYPEGARHEALSVALVEGSDALRGQATDWDLVLHLIASHHGYCRPFTPAVPDPSPETVEVGIDGIILRASSAHTLARLDSGVSERFWQLAHRYGWWRLAWLEAILRLADHRASEWQQEEDHES